MIAQNTFCSKWKQSPSCETGKFIKYNPITGHRIKDDGTGVPITWVQKAAERPHLGIIVSDLLEKNATPEFHADVLALIEELGLEVVHKGQFDEK